MLRRLFPRKPRENQTPCCMSSSGIRYLSPPIANRYMTWLINPRTRDHQRNCHTCREGVHTSLWVRCSYAVYCTGVLAARYVALLITVFLLSIKCFGVLAERKSSYPVFTYHTVFLYAAKTDAWTNLRVLGNLWLGKQRHGEVAPLLLLE